MTTILDILSGTIIGGFVLLLTLTATDTGTRNFVNYNADAIVQNQMAWCAEVIEYDLRKMGFGIPEYLQNTIIQIGTPSHLKFLSHLNLTVKYDGATTFDNIPDTIEYKILPADTLDFPDTTVVMFKVMKTVKISPNYSKTQMIGKIGNSDVFRYLDQVGNPVPIIMATRMVEVTIMAFSRDVILSPELVSDKLKGIKNKDIRRRELLELLRPSFWRQTRQVSKNLRR
jgi:hypothetical protein